MKYAPKLKAKDIEEIRRMLLQGVSKAALSRTYGVDRSLVSRIASGTRWKPNGKRRS
jgi:DNA invertase Pin-like site-specific DNA recombinase